MKSSKPVVGPLQSSKTRTSGCSSASASKNRRHAANASSCEPGDIAGLPDERTQVRQHPLRVLVDQLLDRARELRLDLVVAVRLEDAGLRLHHLAERPVADALAVRQRTSLPPVRQLAAALDRLEELADEPALADARDADQRDELRRALLSCPRERADEQLDLALASDELRARLRREVDAEACARLAPPPRPATGCFLALRLDRRRARGTRSSPPSRDTSSRRRGCRSRARRTEAAPRC